MTTICVKNIPFAQLAFSHANVQLIAVQKPTTASKAAMQSNGHASQHHRKCNSSSILSEIFDEQ